MLICEMYDYRALFEKTLQWLSAAVLMDEQTGLDKKKTWVSIIFQQKTSQN